MNPTVILKIMLLTRDGLGLKKIILQKTNDFGYDHAPLSPSLTLHKI